MEGLISLEGKELGKGAFGLVYLGFDIKEDNYVALKKIPQKISNDPLQLEALANEILIATEVSGQNLVKIKDIVDIGPDKYLVYEYCNGGDLRLYLKYFGNFNERLVQLFIRQILFGIAELHNKKIVHHDIKPENILVIFNEPNLSKNDLEKFDKYLDKVKGYLKTHKFNIYNTDYNENNPIELKNKTIFNNPITDNLIIYLLSNSLVKVSDFGLSKFSNEQNEKLRSGSPLYMSPEIFEPNVQTSTIENPLVDVWAVGILAYELFFGTRPFNSPDGQLNGLIDNLNLGKYEINLKKCGKISKQFLGFLNLCLQNNPKDRVSAEELLLSEFVTAEVESFTYISLGNLHSYPFSRNLNHPHEYVLENSDKLYMDSKDQKFLATRLEI